MCIRQISIAKVRMRLGQERLDLAAKWLLLVRARDPGTVDGLRELKSNEPLYH